MLRRIPRPVWVSGLIWFVAGCLQSGLTELHPDEAYYWQCGQFLDWGYFHQPPMIDLFIRVGFALLHNELGVRLLTVCASTLGMLMLFALTETKDAKTFILVYLGLILTHAGSFMAVPDSPLIFFSLIFLLLLKRYIRQDSYPLALAMAIVVAALMYSKYHAIILFASALLAVPRLLLRRSFWLMAGLSAVLFLPHILWQIDHDLVSFKFHWLIRDKKLWDVGILWDYLGGQLIMLGPVGILLAVAVFRSRVRDTFDRALLFILIGFFGFFLVMGLRGKVEANWTAIGFLPLIVLGVRSAEGRPKMLRVLRYTALACAVVLVLARIYIASPWAGEGIKLNLPMKGWQTWATAIRQKADGKPVFFHNSYQYASEYSFYSGEQGYHWSSVDYNGNQFDLWDIDRAVEGREIVLALPFGNDTAKMVQATGFRPLYLRSLAHYRSLRNLRFSFRENSHRAEAGSVWELQGVLTNGLKRNIQLDSLMSVRPLKLFFYLNGTRFPTERIGCDGCTGRLTEGESKAVSFRIHVPDSAGRYFMRFGWDFAFGMPEENSDFIKLIVRKRE